MVRSGLRFLVTIGCRSPSDSGMTKSVQTTVKAFMMFEAANAQEYGISTPEDRQASVQTGGQEVLVLCAGGGGGKDRPRKKHRKERQ
eukprot:SAG22_NODE_6101_length_898_cov_1.405507_1_plen_87_part_00